MRNILAGLVVASGFVVAVVILSLLTAIPVYFLWNWLMPDLFRLPTISIWQALGLIVLTSLLFKSNSSKKD